MIDQVIQFSFLLPLPPPFPPKRRGGGDEGGGGGGGWGDPIMTRRRWKGGEGREKEYVKRYPQAGDSP